MYEEKTSDKGGLVKRRRETWHTAASAAYLNIGLQPTPYSVRSCLAPALGRGSPRALGAKGTQGHPRQGTPKTKGIAKTKGIQDKNMPDKKHARPKACQDSGHGQEAWITAPATFGHQE